MKILQVVKLYYPWIGGVEKTAQDIAEWVKGKMQIDILSCAPSGKGRLDIVNNIRVFRSASLGIFLGMPVSFSFLPNFAKMRNNYQIIDFHHPFPLADLALFLFPPKAKIIVHYHSDIVRQKLFSFFLKPLFLNTLKKADKIIVSNPNLLKSSALLNKFKQKCLVIPFGISLEEFDNLRDEKEIKRIKEKYGKFALFAGRLSYYKGVDYLIKAIRKTGINLVIIGEGKRKKKLELLAKQEGVEDKIFFLKHQERKKLINFYWACQLFVLPSIFKSETFGIVILEAMACGKPIISTELGTGTSWININGETGFVVPPKDSEAISRAINKIISDQKLKKAMGEKAAERARKYFTKEKFISSTLKALTKD